MAAMIEVMEKEQEASRAKIKVKITEQKIKLANLKDQCNKCKDIVKKSSIIPSWGLKYKQPYNTMEIGEDSMKLINISNGKLEKLGAYGLSFSTSEGLSPGSRDIERIRKYIKFIVDKCKV